MSRRPTPGPTRSRRPSGWSRSPQEFGFPNALVVFCDIEADGAEAQLDRHLAASSPRARRPDPGAPERSRHGGLQEGYAALGKRGLSYELNASPGKLLSGRDVAKAYPDVQVILGHAGFPVQRDDAYFAQWRSEMSALGEVENVACKVSGFGMADNHWTIDSIRPWVLHCIEAFGPATGSCSARTGRSTSCMRPTSNRPTPTGGSSPTPASAATSRKGCSTGTPNVSTGSEPANPSRRSAPPSPRAGPSRFLDGGDR